MFHQSKRLGLGCHFFHIRYNQNQLASFVHRFEINTSDESMKEFQAEETFIQSFFLQGGQTGPQQIKRLAMNGSQPCLMFDQHQTSADIHLHENYPKAKFILGCRLNQYPLDFFKSPWHNWTEIRWNSIWVYLGSKGTRRTLSSRASKQAPTSKVSRLAPRTL